MENIPANLDYGFYRISKRLFLDEYGNKLNREPKLLGTFGVFTAWGVAYEIHKEMIIGDFIFPGEMPDAEYDKN